MPSAADPRLVNLYTRAMICQTFPAYKLHELRDTPATELLLAMKLMETANKARS